MLEGVVYFIYFCLGIFSFVSPASPFVVRGATEKKNDFHPYNITNKHLPQNKQGNRYLTEKFITIVKGVAGPQATRVMAWGVEFFLAYIKKFGVVHLGPAHLAC
jgi:hypothetical protein